MTNSCTLLIGSLKIYKTTFLTLYMVHCSLKLKLVLVMDTIHIYSKVCSCIYRICCDGTLRIYEYGTILQLIIQLIYYKVCSCVYRICSDRTWGKYEYGTILQLIIQLIYYKVCSIIHTGYVVTELEGYMNMGQYYS